MHVPVLYNEVIYALQPQPGGKYVDCTLGAGGHAFGILEASGPDGRLLGLDLDPHALDIAEGRLTQFGKRVIMVKASFVTLERQLSTLGWKTVNGVLLDLGVSSMQLDMSERGFSFRSDAPLDMRFDPQEKNTAADLVNNLPESDLADLIYRFGEERGSRRIARAIVAARPIHTTGQLAAVVAKAASGRKSNIHPATRTFQALRIATNSELDAVEQVLPKAVSVLEPGGRLAVISFHSLEDRIVKQFFRNASQDCLCPPKQPICTCGHTAQVKEITRKPIVPTQSESKQNPRARSAKLRVVEKL